MARNEIDLKLDYKAPIVGAAGKKLGIGIVGAGFIVADCHIPSYLAAGFNVVGICSRDPANAGKVAARHGIKKVYRNHRELAADPAVQVIDVAVPPNAQSGIIRDVLSARTGLRGILAQKPLGMDYAQAAKIVELCERAGVTLGVNQNMRYDQSIRALKCVLERGYLGEPVLATIDMRAIPHWMPWQKDLGRLTLQIMSVHHIDCFRFLFGDPERIYASVRTDPRTKFPHTDGICAYILEYENGLRAMSLDDVWTGPAREGAEADIAIRWRVEGTRGLARGTIGWPDYPHGSPSTVDFTTLARPGYWFCPRWKERWFPHAFEGTMAQLLIAIDKGVEPAVGGRDNLETMALVDAAYRSAKEHRAVTPQEIAGGKPRR
jgi:hypothetical protein